LGIKLWVVTWRPVGVCRVPRISIVSFSGSGAAQAHHARGPSIFNTKTEVQAEVQGAQSPVAA
jgi:hypothetical protein